MGTVKNLGPKGQLCSWHPQPQNEGAVTVRFPAVVQQQEQAHASTLCTILRLHEAPPSQLQKQLNLKSHTIPNKDFGISIICDLISMFVYKSETTRHTRSANLFTILIMQ